MATVYGWEKLHKAISRLCGRGPLSERLGDALADSLVKILPEVDLPRRIAGEFEAFLKRLNVSKEMEKKDIMDTISKMSADEVDQSVALILGFFNSMRPSSES